MVFLTTEAFRNQITAIENYIWEKTFFPVGLIYFLSGPLKGFRCYFNKGATNRAHNVKMYANISVAYAEFLEAIKSFVRQ